MTEQPTTKVVDIASPLGLIERRKRRGWSNAVYYLLLEGGNLVLLRPFGEEERWSLQALAVGAGGTITTKPLGLVVRTVSVRTSYAQLSGDRTATGISGVCAVIASTREASDNDEVQALIALGTDFAERAPVIVAHTEVTADLVHSGGHIYVTVRGLVYECRPVSYGVMGLSELRVSEKDGVTIRILEELPSVLRPSHWAYDVPSGSKQTWTKVGPFDHIIRSSREMTATEIRERLGLPGRNGQRKKSSPAAR